MIFGRQSLHGHAEVVADLPRAAESPTGCHVQLDGKVTNEPVGASERSRGTAAAGLLLRPWVKVARTARGVGGGQAVDEGRKKCTRVSSLTLSELEDSCIYILRGQNVQPSFTANFPSSSPRKKTPGEEVTTHTHTYVLKSAVLLADTDRSARHEAVRASLSPLIYNRTVCRALIINTMMWKKGAV